MRGAMLIPDALSCDSCVELISMKESESLQNFHLCSGEKQVIQMINLSNYWQKFLVGVPL